MRARKIAFSLALACAACAGPTDPSTTPPVSVRAADVSAALPPVDPLNAAPAEARLGALVHVLASAQLEGRSVGSAGLGRAEALVRTRLAALGVRPFFPKGFRQRVAFSRRADVEGMATTLFTREGPHTLPELFWPASFSGEGPFSGKLTHFRLDDFIARSVSMMRSVMRSPQGVAGPPREVVHKRVLVLAVTRRPRSPARLDTQTAVLRQGALAAQALGAAAVLYWHNNGSTDAAPARLRSDEAVGPVSLPVGFIRASVARELSRRPAATARGVVAMRRALTTAHNLVGQLGEGCGRRAPILLAAHLDHLGVRSTPTSPNAPPRLHPGADDNASGVAVLLEVAARLAARLAARGEPSVASEGHQAIHPTLQGPPRPSQGSSSARATPRDACFLFAFFTGKESGLAGSSALADTLAARGQRPQAVLNVDAVGRLGTLPLRVAGMESAPEWPTLVSHHARAAGFAYTPSRGERGDGDEWPFKLRGVPALRLSTTPHAGHHGPDDVPDRIDRAGAVRIARFLTSLAIALSQRALSPPPVAPAQRDSAPSGSSRGQRP